MAEKVIHEVRIIETEDGFRIEVKGDKERLREMGCGPGMGFFGPNFGRGPHRHGRHGGWRRHGHRGFGFGPFGMCADWWADKPETDEEATEEEK